jgi:hypothetical protein
MQNVFIGEIDQHEIYQELYTNITGRDAGSYMGELNIHSLFTKFNGRKVKVTIETLDEDPPEDMVTVTYKEIFRRARNHMDTFGIVEGGYDDDIWDLHKSHALLFMSEEEFAGRCHSAVGA